MSDTPRSRGEEIIALMQELREMPEKKIQDEIHALDTSYFVYSRNYDLANAFLEHLEHGDENADLGHMDMHHKLVAMHFEVARLLHNHVASAKSLAEHMRKLYRHLYATSGRFPEYEEEVSRRFAHDPVVQFVQGLRNILLHDKSVALQFSGTVGEQAENHVGIPSEYLIAHDGHFNEPAKKYLETAGEKVDIHAVLMEYHKKVVVFYSWFYAKQQQIHKDEFARYKAKETRLMLLQIEDNVDSWLADPDPVTNPAPSDRGLFLWVFNKPEFDELELLPESSSARADKVIELLKQRIVVPPEIESKIRRCYADPNFFRYDLWAPKAIDDIDWDNEEEPEGAIE